MIDIETMVFDTVYNGLILLFPDINVTAGYDEQNAIFPTVIVRETNNQPYRASATDDCAENHTRLTYEIEVESDKENTARSECKAILNAADDIMQSMKFRRVHKNRPINIDRTVWRQYARYEVIVGKPVTYDAGTENERTVYQMYRR
jgi:hypothetical protein